MLLLMLGIILFYLILYKFYISNISILVDSSIEEMKDVIIDKKINIQNNYQEYYFSDVYIPNSMTKEFLIKTKNNENWIEVNESQYKSLFINEPIDLISKTDYYIERDLFSSKAELEIKTKITLK